MVEGVRGDVEKGGRERGENDDSLTHCFCFLVLFCFLIYFILFYFVFLC